MAITAQDAFDDLEILKKDLSDVTTTIFLSWANAANRFVYRYICGIDPERFVSTASYTVTSAPQTSALPADFQDIQRFDMGFYYVDNAGKDTNYPLVQTGPGSISQGYYIVGTDVVFTGLTTGTYKLRYLPNPTRITAMTGAGSYFTVDASSTGKVIIPDQFLDFLAQDLDVYYDRWDEDPSAESLADFRFSRTLTELAANIRRTPAVFVMPSDGGGYFYPANGGFWY